MEEGHYHKLNPKPILQQDEEIEASSGNVVMEDSFHVVTFRDLKGSTEVTVD